MTVRALRNAREITVDSGTTEKIERPATKEQLRPQNKKMREAIGGKSLIETAPVELDVSSIRTKSDLMKILLSIVDARSKGRRVALVFDIDNTLMDTRHRTAGAAASFVHRGQNPLANATYESVAYRPDDTCAAHKVYDADTQKAFRDHFDSFFWNPANLALDKPLAGPVALAKLARSLGAELYFLTGRTSTFRDQTVAQLEQAGLAPESAQHLIMKSPKRDKDGRLESTEKFKAREVRKIYRRRVSIAGFVTEGARDMCWLQKHVPEIRKYLFLQFPIDEPGYQVAQDRTLFLPLDLNLPTREEVLARFAEAKV